MPTLAPHPEITAESTAQEIVAWSLSRFAGQRLVLTTGFGMEGCALIDLYARESCRLEVIWVDTGFLFSETHRLRSDLEQRYPGVDFVRHSSDLTPEDQTLVHGAELWKGDPDLCCRIRKVDPLRAALQGVDVWVTGLRREQSPARAELPVLGWDWRYRLLKLNPLASWSREEVWSYVRENDVPINRLHHEGYPSLGCTHCTRAVKGAGIADYDRSGRWSEQGKTECGLHFAVGSGDRP